MLSVFFPGEAERRAPDHYPELSAYSQEGTQNDVGEEGCDWGSQGISGITSCGTSTTCNLYFSYCVLGVLQW